MEKRALLGLGLLAKFAVPALGGAALYGWGKNKYFDEPAEKKLEQQKITDKYFADWAARDKEYYDSAAAYKKVHGFVPKGSAADLYGTAYAKKPFIDAKPKATIEKPAFDLSEYAPGLKEGLSASVDAFKQWAPNFTSGLSNLWNQFKTKASRAWEPMRQHLHQQGLIKGLWTMAEKPKKVHYVSSPEEMGRAWDKQWAEDHPQ